MYAFKTHDRKVVFCSEQPSIDKCLDERCKFGRHWRANGYKVMMDAEIGNGLIGFKLDKEECICVNVDDFIHFGRIPIKEKE